MSMKRAISHAHVATMKRLIRMMQGYEVSSKKHEMRDLTDILVLVERAARVGQAVE